MVSESCPNCDLRDCPAHRAPSIVPMHTLARAFDCERRAKERALAEVARLQARIAAAKAECAPGRTYPCRACGDAAADELCSNVLDALNAKEADHG